MEAGTLLANYTSVLVILLRLRQICDAASLCPADLALPPAAGAAGLDKDQLQRLVNLLRVRRR